MTLHPYLSQYSKLFQMNPLTLLSSHMLPQEESRGSEQWNHAKTTKINESQALKAELSVHVPAFSSWACSQTSEQCLEMVASRQLVTICWRGDWLISRTPCCPSEHNPAHNLQHTPSSQDLPLLPPLEEAWFSGFIFSDCSQIMREWLLKVYTLDQK